MATEPLVLKMSLQDELSGGLARAGNSLQEFGRTFNRVGKEMQQVGRNMAFISGAIIAPFAAAMVTAEKSSFAVAEQMTKLKNTTNQFSIEMAKSALPSLKAFNDGLIVVVRAYQDLGDETKEAVASFALITSGILAAAGATLIFGGALVKLAPILMAAASAYLLFQTAQTQSGRNVGFGGFFGIGASAAKPQQMIQDMNVYLKKFEELKKQMASGVNVGKQLADMMADINLALQGQSQKLDQTKQAWSEFQMAAQQTLASIGQAMSTHLGNAAFDAITGRLRGLRAVFSSLSQDILRMLVNLIVRFAMFKAFTAIGGSVFGGMAKGLGFHEGGIIKAHEGLAPDEVPIIAQTGEGVLSRRGMAALGGSNNLRKLNSGRGMGGTVNYNPVVVIQAWDSKDVMRNRKALMSTLEQGIKENSSIRNTLKRYL